MVAGLKKSRTFLLTKSPSLLDHQFPPPPPPCSIRTSTSSTSLAPKKYPVEQFPTSPQLIFGEEMLHFGHPQHPLALVNLPDRFKCNGCKEDGAGKRFVCQQCNFQLHDFCASAPPVLKAHPLHFQHQLFLFSKPVKGGQSKCDVCNKASKGYAFRCNACSFQMHPCCAMLSSEMNLFSAHPHPLRLLPEYHDQGSGGGGSTTTLCGECNRKRAGRMYHCTVCDYHLHAVCAKNMINGFRENGIKDKDKPNNMLGTAARLASQVMIDLIGVLIEGIGEGFGQAIVQDVTKGRSSAVRK